DLSRVWVQAQVYASNANWVEKGNRVKLEIPFMPGRSWEGKVDYVYPFMEAETRTVTARLVIDNQKGLLKPNMFATANIYADPLEDVLTIPRNALIRTGKEEVVIQALGDGRFYPREVKAGIESGGKVQIKSGLKQGQRVVTSAQFLIDAESDLQAGMRRMDASSTQDNATSGDKSSGGGGMGHQH
ncbi:MAG: efflux RND transporter periplasmic adaptor subunit, partial [Thermodesulfobacteriota bacterium]